MTDAAEKLKSSLAGLPIADRAELAHFLIGSLDDEADADAEAAWDTELERRRQEILSGQAGGVPAEQVFAELREKYR